MDFNYTLNKIKEYDTIIIHRHKNPDIDALGSQLGLANLLKHNFRKKNVYVVGEDNHFSWMGLMDKVEDEVFTDALCIICDVAVSHLVDDERYKLAKERIVIDHHRNTSDIDGFEMSSSDYKAASQIIADFMYDMKLKVSKRTATFLFSGIASDTGRFTMRDNNPGVLAVTAKLLQSGAESAVVYDNLFQDTLERRQQKAYFSSQIKYTKNNVAYLMNDKDIIEKFNTNSFSVSRGMVGLMSGTKDVPIWCNFTYDTTNNNIMCEFRSHNIIIVDIAKKYGGGGHNTACGATINSFDEVSAILEDFDKLLEEN
ncbi:MAG: bifunctional oligoribonuclease/PAP phosphatase NrnA [bacterium]